MYGIDVPKRKARLLASSCVPGRAKPLVLVVPIILCLVIIRLAPVLAHDDPHNSITRITLLIQQDPTNAELYVKRGELHRISSHWDLALADFDRVAQLQPNHENVDFHRGRLLFEAGQFQPAGIALDHFLSAHPNHIEGLIVRGRLLRKLGQPLDAAADYAHALSLVPNPTPVLFIEQAEALAEAGEAYVDAALARIDQLLTEVSRKEKWLARRGEILEKAGRFEEARAFDGAIDEVRIWNRALTPVEVLVNLNTELTGSEPGLVAYFRLNEGAGQTGFDATENSNDGLLSSTINIENNDPDWVSSAPTNQPPVVDAGPDQGITLPTNTVNLDGTVTDDGLPSGGLTITWSLVSGSGPVTFSTPDQLDTEATISGLGTYVIRLTADDGELFVSDELTVILQPRPYPDSTVITGIQWAPASAITRSALGSDNWPITWADDNNLYTAYGDGYGFDPPSSQKLSLGYSKMTGPPTAFVGVNIPSPTGEELGGGPQGKKASSMLMVDGVLYQWVRNANNNGEQCQLAWSTDRAATWEWSPWQFSEFGYCVFLNFGHNSQGRLSDGK